MTNHTLPTPPSLDAVRCLRTRRTTTHPAPIRSI